MHTSKLTSTLNLQPFAWKIDRRSGQSSQPVRTQEHGFFFPLFVPCLLPIITIISLSHSIQTTSSKDLREGLGVSWNSEDGRHCELVKLADGSIGNSLHYYNQNWDIQTARLAYDEHQLQLLFLIYCRFQKCWHKRRDATF